MKNLNLNSGNFIFDNYEHNKNNLNKSYRIVGNINDEQKRNIAILDGGNVQFLNGRYWITF